MNEPVVFGIAYFMVLFGVLTLWDYWKRKRYHYED